MHGDIVSYEVRSYDNIDRGLHDSPFLQITLGVLNSLCKYELEAVSLNTRGDISTQILRLGLRRA